MKIIFLVATVFFMVGETLVFASPFVPLPVERRWDPEAIHQEVGLFSYRADWAPTFAGQAQNLLSTNGLQALPNTYAAEQQGLYVQAGYRPLVGWEGFVRLGAANLVVTGAGVDTLSDFEGDFRPFGSLGVKGILFDSKYLQVSSYLDGTYFANQRTDDISVVSSAPIFGNPDVVTNQEGLEIKNQWEANGGLTVAAGYKGLTFYGGPVVYWRRATLAGRLEIDGDVYQGTIADLEEQGQVGMVAGIRIQIGRFGEIHLEAEQKSDTSISSAMTYVRLAY